MKVQEDGDQNGRDSRGDTEPRSCTTRQPVLREEPQSNELTGEAGYRCCDPIECGFIRDLGELHDPDVTIT